MPRPRAEGRTVMQGITQTSSSSTRGVAREFSMRRYSVRGATAGQTYSIPVTLVTQVLYLWLVGVSDLRSVLGFGIATSLANFGYQYALLAVRWMEWRKDRPLADSQARL